MSLAKLEGAKAADRLEPLLQEKVATVRGEAAAALLPFRQDLAGAVLRAIMRSPDPGLRSSVALALGQSANTAALPYLLELVRDELPRPRIVAVRYIGHLGNRNNLAVLKASLSDPDNAVQVTAAGAIGRIIAEGK